MLSFFCEAGFMTSILGLWKESGAFPGMPAGEVAWVCAAPIGTLPADGNQPDGDVLASWAEGLASRRERVRGGGCLRFAFYWRVSTEDWQDPVMSRLTPRAGSPASRGLPAAGSADLGVCRTWILIIQRIDRGGGWTRSSAL